MLDGTPYLEAVPARGVDLFGAACARDLEGIVAKWARGTYQADGRATSWLKVKNRDYSQMVGRHELFEARHVRTMRKRRTVSPALRLV